ncbi:hypothetical protein MKX01_028018 [Papaver californicum]|nr:hypothetical protein MKX01_028018 [Papaver californicum]
MPGLPGPIQRQDLDKVAKTYGKTIHFWQVDKGDAFPLGLSQIMMALIRDDQLQDNLAKGTFLCDEYTTRKTGLSDMSF